MTDKPCTMSYDEWEIVQQVDECRRAYEQTGNPVYPWTAIGVLTSVDDPENKLEFPAWLRHYLGQAAPEILGLFGYPIFELLDSKKVRDTLARALGFASVRGKSAAPGEFGRSFRDGILGHAVITYLVSGRSRNETEAYLDVADEFSQMWGLKLSESTVERAYKSVKSIRRK